MNPLRTINFSLFMLIVISVVISLFVPEYRDGVLRRAISISVIVYSCFLLGMQYERARYGKYYKGAGPVKRFFLLILRFFVDKVREGEKIHLFHGIAYFLPEEGASVTILIPFHFIIGFIHRTYYWSMHYFRKDKFYSAIRKAYAFGYSNGLNKYVDKETSEEKAERIIDKIKEDFNDK